jgi:hypothetical protein
MIIHASASPFVVRTEEDDEFERICSEKFKESVADVEMKQEKPDTDEDWTPKVQRTVMNLHGPLY